MAKQDDYVRYTIRVPADLYERIKDAAGEKSLNAEIVEALAEKYPAPLIMDQESFVHDWIEPILTLAPKRFEREYDSDVANEVTRLLHLANKAARKMDPAIGVWERMSGGRWELVFGIRDKSLLPPDRRSFLAQNFTTMTWRLA